MSMKNNVAFYLLLSVLAVVYLFSTSHSVYSNENNKCVDNTELAFRCEGDGPWEFKFVMDLAGKKCGIMSFKGPQPMPNKGKIAACYCGGNRIELESDEIIDGIISTKNYGKIKMYGIGQPFYLMLTSEQYEALKALKSK